MREENMTRWGTISTICAKLQVNQKQRVKYSNCFRNETDFKIYKYCHLSKLVNIQNRNIYSSMYIQ